MLISDTLRRAAAFAPFVVLAVAALSFTTATAAAALPPPKYGDAHYKFRVVAFSELAGFEQPGFDDSAWPAGAAAFGSFGSEVGQCPLVIDEKTLWPVNTDLLLRREFELPQVFERVQVRITIDNDVQAFMNGHDISGGLQIHDECPFHDSFVFDVPRQFLLPGGTNLLAVRGHDRGGESFLDVQVDVRLGTQPPNAVPPAASATGA